MSSNNVGKTIKRIYIGKKKIIIKLDDDKLTLPLEVFTKLYLYEGKTLSQEDLNNIAELSDNAKYLEYAKKSIISNLCSEENMRRKLLKKGANEKQIDSIIAELKNYSLIDDDKYIRYVIDSLVNKNYGNKRIAIVLTNKGISNEDILKYLPPSDSEINRAKNILPKLERKYSLVNYSSKKKKIYDALIRLGYEHDVASETLKDIKKCDYDSELMLLRNDYKKRMAKLNKKEFDKYEKARRITNYLLGKGYQYKDIIKVMEEIENESRMD